MIKVMIVEDDPMVMEINKGYVEASVNFEIVDTAKDGMEAYKKLLKNKMVDLVIADIFMPGTTGVELIKMVRRKEISVDFIFVTASKDIEDVESTMQYGAFDYLVKPFNYDRFSKTLIKYSDYFNLKRSIKSKEVTQSTIDSLINSNQNNVDEEGLPKGLHKDTFEKIIDYMDASKSTEFTLQKMSIDLAITTVTLRKYMTYIEKIGIVSLRKEYGDIGRPKVFYIKMDK